MAVPQVVKPEPLEIDAVLFSVLDYVIHDPHEDRCGVLDGIASKGRFALAALRTRLSSVRQNSHSFPSNSGPHKGWRDR